MQLLAVVNIYVTVSSDLISFAAKSPTVIKQKANVQAVFHRREALSKPIDYYSKIEAILWGKSRGVKATHLSVKFLSERAELSRSTRIVHKYTNASKAAFSLTDLPVTELTTTQTAVPVVSVQRA